MRIRNPLISLVAVLMLAPLIVLVIWSFVSPAPEWDFVRDELLPAHMWETGALLFLSVMLALIFGVGAAWVISVFDFPGRGFFRWALVLPLALPTYISAITYAQLLGPTGSLKLAWGLPFDIVNLQGLSLVFALVLFPYIYLPARAAFSGGLAHQLDAARMLGGGALRRFGRVAVPLARPAIIGGAFLVAMEALNDYGAVKYYGVRSLTAGIFRSWGGLYDVGSALRLSGLLLIIVLLLDGLERRSRRGAFYLAGSARATRIPLYGGHRLLAVTSCALLLMAAFLLPCGSIVMDAFRTADTARLARMVPALGNTLTIGMIAALLTLTLGLLFAYAERHGDARSTLIRWAGIGYVVPGAVIALGVMAMAGRLAEISGIVLIGGLSLLAYALSVRFLALAGQPLRAGLAQQPRAMDESARLLGASSWRTFRQVNLPLLRPAIIGAALLVTMEVVKELPLTMILRPFDFNTLSTQVFELARIEQWAEAGWPALCIVVCGLIPVVALDRLLDKARH